MPDTKKINRTVTFQKPSVPPVKTVAAPRLTERETWEREEEKPALPPSDADAARIKALSRRSLLWSGITLATTLGGLWAFNRNPPDDKPDAPGYVPLISGAKAPLRKALEFNEAVARTVFFSPRHRAQEFARSQAITPRNNYHGDTPVVDLDAWTLTLEGERGRTTPHVLKLADITDLPEVSQTTELKCIEGWSAIANWSGVRFYDFLRKFPPPDGTRYVGMFSEPEGQDDSHYYIGLDIESAMHPQSLLATKLNGETLDSEHGAPLRLVMPHKYGIKNIKLITRIVYTNTRPADYWHERGYDWYAGL